MALVKDTFEFCGNVVPIGLGMSNDEHRMHKTKSGLTSILRRHVCLLCQDAARSVQL